MTKLARTPAAQRARVAFAALHARYRDLIHTTALRVLGDQYDAEDATQEILLKVHSALSDGRCPTEGADLERWLRAVARRHALDLRKRRHRARARDQRYGEADRQRHLRSPLESRLDARRSARLLMRAQPDALLLAEHCVVLPCDRGELARRLGITRGALNLRVHRALRRLRNELDRR